mmetsp:Transcript_2551/g.9855  ORF Transcript_2551/g.9855 Transcript_2551/m.9855 type:complete len:238 (+) Transcript_2551:493-1206(+)
MRAAQWSPTPGVALLARGQRGGTRWERPDCADVGMLQGPPPDRAVASFPLRLRGRPGRRRHDGLALGRCAWAGCHCQDAPRRGSRPSAEFSGPQRGHSAAARVEEAQHPVVLELPQERPASSTHRPHAPHQQHPCLCLRRDRSVQRGHLLGAHCSKGLGPLSWTHCFLALAHAPCCGPVAARCAQQPRLDASEDSCAAGHGHPEAGAGRLAGPVAAAAGVSDGRRRQGGRSLAACRG